MKRLSLAERRASVRFDKVIPVTLSTPGYGETRAVARNISSGGMMVETPLPFPLGSEVTISFDGRESRSSIRARGEVKNYYAFNYCDDDGPRAARGIGIRFLEFLEETEEPSRYVDEEPRTTLH